MTIQQKRIILILLPLFSWINLAASPLFENGKTDWKIYCSSQDDNGIVKYAATELQETLKKISKADFIIVTQPVKKQMIVINVNMQPNNSDKISIVTKNGNLYLTGNSPSAALYAVYVFLQRELDVRWLWPGKSGEFIPEKTCWTLPKLNYCFTPSIRYRGFHLCCNWRDIDNFRVWMARNFINIWRHGNNKKIKHLGMHNMYSSHNARLPRSLFKEHPKYFALINGKRFVSQMCLNNPKVDKIISDNFEHFVKSRPGLEILSIFPPDNQDYCQCEKCAAKGVSTSWFDFYNRLTDKLKVRFPKLKFSTIAYQGYITVPKNPVRNSVFVEYATYARCNIHSFDSKCEHNKKLLVEIKKWQKTGLKIVNYAYEFDTFGFKYCRFLPFFSMIDDTIKSSVKNKLTGIITEVALAPKGGSDINSFAGKNRLPLYLYAQLLWNPQAKMEELLRDWCNTIYGKAADPMFRYFMLLDDTWSSMKQHKGIMGNPSETANELLSNSVQKGVKKLFAEADMALDGGGNIHVEYEKALYNQWLSLLSNKNEVNLPKIVNKKDLNKSFFRLPKINIKAAWSPKALYFCNIVPPFEISIGTGIGGEKSHFEINKDGKQSAYRISSVGIRDSHWNPKWSFKNGIITIPFTILGKYPQADNVWQIKIKNNNKVFPSENTASLRFSSLSQTGRYIIWWAGGPNKNAKKIQDKLRYDFLKSGWQMQIIRNAKVLNNVKPVLYYFQHPNGPNKFPAEKFAPVREAVKAGATVIFCSYWQMPLEKYFNDPSFKLKVKPISNLTITERRSRYLVPGKWSLKPHNLNLRKKITPAYGLMPEKPKAWKVIATMDINGKKPGKTIPYILARSYGKGVVIALGTRIAARSSDLIDNLYTNRQELLNAPDVQ